MICKKCGAALPGRGMICKACGATMAPDQVEGMRQINKAQQFGSTRIPIKPILEEDNDYENLNNYKTSKENKFLGVVIILVILLIVIVIAILNFVSNA